MKRKGDLWSFMRQVLSQGQDIWLDHQTRSYEEKSARLDAAARERAEQLEQLLDGFSAWQPIETAPRDGTHILVTDVDDPRITTVVAFVHGEWKYCTDHGRISHWQPLPAPPGEGPEPLCPHGMVLADNVCGPCSEGRPNRAALEPTK